MDAPSQAKQAAKQTISREEERLVGLSHRIHAHPELAFEEERAAGWVADALDAVGFTVEHGVCDLPTAVRATAGSGPLNLAICAEYDALPDIGHACGHNMIAAMAVGAGAALAPLADDLGLTVTVLGTPAEEGGGGKILMLQRGAFAGVHAAMMVHPSPVDIPRAHTLAVSHLKVRYAGRSAHASSFPERGVNAGDAFTVAQVAVGLLRQHLPAGVRVHGIVTKGGEAPNVVPEHTEGRWYVRAATLTQLEKVEPRVRRCFEAGALATGAELEIEEESPPYSEFRNDAALGELYRRNAEELGRVFPDLGDVFERTAGSTDMANVSLALPAIHPHIGIDSWPAVNHQPEFAAHCVTDVADKALLDGATAMAWTAVDAADDDTTREHLLSATSP